MSTYIFLLLVAVVVYLVWKRQKPSVSYINLNNQRVSLSEVKSFSEEKIAALVTDIFQSKGYQVQKASGELQDIADFMIEKEGNRGFVSTRHWRADKVGVSDISQEVIGMNQHNSHYNYIFTMGKFDKEATEMAKYNRNLFMVDGHQLNAMVVNVQQNAMIANAQ
ncbi:restriction endonuclease [Advenella alkanexedens]|uniref:Restriction endonuclease n=1 Tax=Advenella alkanexedens TaxID=1481665 RepID=A0ABS6NQ57_9BURK|nr:restriction endonuclease [Advenella alkanexedens]MBV4397768.1 restriction endonuclease [Advenella alkanexedens]